MNFSEHINKLWDWFITSSIELCKSIVLAILAFIIGRLVIKLILKLIERIFKKHQTEVTIQGFVLNLVKVTLWVLLVLLIIGILGVKTTSIAAVLASAGLGIGMALSGTLQNFAGGVMILIFKPFKVGDYIEAQNEAGTVHRIKIFQTELHTVDNKTIFIPNSKLSNEILVNYSSQNHRRVEWTFSVDYGQDFEQVQQVINKVVIADKRVLNEPQRPAPFIVLNELADSCVNIVVRAWVNMADYWDVYYDINRQVYETFNKAGINFPFPQITVHQANQ